MNIVEFVKLTMAAAYGVFPYAVIFMGLSILLFRNRSLFYRIFASAVGGLTLLSLAATMISNRGFDIFLRFHMILFFLGLPAAVWLIRREKRETSLAELITPPVIPIVILLLALATRIAPLLMTPDFLGGDDARFHNLLSQKVLVERRISITWEPFAPVRVLYPQGSHVLTAMLSHISGVPVHAVLGFLVIVAGTLTVGIIYLMAKEIFLSPVNGAWAAACYAFLPLWGSLDYLRWGGLPNALGMLFLCFVLLILIRNMRSDWRLPGIAAAICIAAIAHVHHYTLLVTGIALLSGLLAAKDAGLKRIILVASLLAVVFCLPDFGIKLLRMSSGVKATSIAVFREEPITLLRAIMDMNILFVAVFVAVMLSARKEMWSEPATLMFAWFAGLFAAFVSLEYVYRGLTLAMSGGKDCYTCLTPSRMATDAVYPMAILCGFMPSTLLWQKYRRPVMMAFCIFAAMTCIASVANQAGRGSCPATRDMAAWIKKNSPENAFIVGNVPHLEYLAWRETSAPPLPASEERNSRRMAWKTRMQSVDEWMLWAMESRRKIYFIFKQGEKLPNQLKPVYHNAEFIVADKRYIDVRKYVK